jgi:PhnB protein
MSVETYLFFNGRCEEALDFYAQAVGATIQAKMRNQDAPDPSMVAPGTGEKILHSSFTVGATTLLASDGQCEGNLNFEGFALTLYAKDEAEAHKLFNALSDGGEVQLPLTETFFSKCFGMLKDRFGLSWMVYVRQ